MNNELNIKIMPVVALRGLVVFPGMLLHFDVGRKKSVSALKAAMKNNQEIFLVAQKDMLTNDPKIDELYNVGVVAYIRQMLQLPGSDIVRVVVEGNYRAEIVEPVKEKPYLSAAVKECTDKTVRSEDAEYEQALIRHAKDLFAEYADQAQRLPPDVLMGVMSAENAGKLADYIAGNINLEYKDRQKILEELNTVRRLENLCVLLTRETELLSLAGDIESKVQEQIDKNQREYYLREQIKAISSELNDGEDPQSEINNYRVRINKANMPQEAQEKLLRECDRLMKLSPGSPEGAVIRTYLDTCLDLPWNKYTKDNFDLENARKILDRDHYGLDKVKQRIIEMLAIRKLSPDITGQIICLVGPPGVGKTSIARSVAKSMGRKYARISLGGVRDEAEIRGHRKTYIGAMPGRIITAMSQAGSSNPLILLDEIDKLGFDYKGDPSSALLEALDGEQNVAFRDNYIELPFDLSKVLFITTANDKSTIPAPLLDRMEVIDLYSYTLEEKFHIAKNHIVPKQIKKHGLNGRKLRFTDDAIRTIIDSYTREAGVRKLEREIAAVCRKAVVKVADGEKKLITVKSEHLETFLGAKKYKPEVLANTDMVGIVNGLAWTSVGGEIMQIEAAVLEGTGRLELTGSLGDVMKESAKIAVSFIRSRAEELGIDKNFYKEFDIHIHAPEGAVPKDGPSAGVTMVTALASALSMLPVRSHIAMTGEISLRGRVLPIGGLKEKTMAAYKAGIKTVIIPSENASDLDEVDAVVKSAINFITVETLDEVLQYALIKPVAAKTAENIDPNAITSTASMNQTKITQ